MTIERAYTYRTLSVGFRASRWRQSCSFVPSVVGSDELPLPQPLWPRWPCASGRLRSQPRHRFIPATPIPRLQPRHRPILDILLLGIPLLDILLLDMLIRRPRPRRRAMPAMIILEPTPAMVIPEPTPAMVIPEPTPAMVIPEPTPIIHTPTGVGLDGAGPAGAGVGVGPSGSRLVGVGEAGGAVADVGTAVSTADLLTPAFTAEASAVAVSTEAVEAFTAAVAASADIVS